MKLTKTANDQHYMQRSHNKYLLSEWRLWTKILSRTLNSKAPGESINEIYGYEDMILRYWFREKGNGQYSQISLKDG